RERRGHDGPHSNAIQNAAPQRIRKHVGDRKSRNDETVLLVGEVRIGKNGGREQRQRVAIDVADRRDQHHGESGEPAHETVNYNRISATRPEFFAVRWFSRVSSSPVTYAASRGNHHHEKQSL